MNLHPEGVNRLAAALLLSAIKHGDTDYLRSPEAAELLEAFGYDPARAVARANAWLRMTDPERRRALEKFD